MRAIGTLSSSHSCRRIFLRVPLSSPTKAQTPSTYFCARVQNPRLDGFIHSIFSAPTLTFPRTQIECQRKCDGKKTRTVVR